MARRKKTWAETHELVPDDTWGLKESLKFAVHRTCQRLGWEWVLERQTQTFCKMKVWLPTEEGKVSNVQIDIYLDADAKNPLAKTLPHLGVGSEDQMMARLTGYDPIPHRKAESDVFVKALKLEITRTTKEWKQTQMGRGKLTDPEIKHRRDVVARAEQLTADDPQKTWKQIALDLDLPERTLREWRHNTTYQ